MGRHRSDPLGGGRAAIFALAAVLALALVGATGFALYGYLTSKTKTGTATATGSPSVPTLKILVTADSCPIFIRVPGGDILYDETANKGVSVVFTRAPLVVQVCDTKSVQVFIDGKPRPLTQSQFNVP